MKKSRMWQIFFTKLLISANNHIGQRNHSRVKVFNVLMYEIFRNLAKVAWKREKSVHIEVIVVFGRKLCVCFDKKLRSFPQKSLPDNQFVPC